MPHADLFFPFPRPLADALAGALAPESEPAGDAPRADVPKTRGRAWADAGGLRVAIEADDLASLRAAVNSYCRWVDAAAKAAALGVR